MSKRKLRTLKYSFLILSYLLLFAPLFVICIIYREEFFTKNVGGFTVGLGGALAVVYIMVLIKIGFNKISPVISTGILVIVMYCLQTILSKGFILSIGLFAGVTLYEIVQMPYKHFAKLTEAYVTEEIKMYVREKPRKMVIKEEESGRC